MRNMIFTMMSLLWLSSNLLAQVPQFEWAAGFGGNNYDEGRSLALDSAGNVYTIGYFQSTVDFDPGNGTYNLSSSGDEDIYISKLDASGNLAWARNIGGSSSDFGASIALDTAGNVYTIGYFSDSVDFDPGIGTYGLTSNGDYDIFILKIDASGNFIWAITMGNSSADYGTSIALDAAGNVYATGHFEGTIDFSPGSGTCYLSSNGAKDIFVLKLDSLGNFIWARNMGGSSSDYSMSIALDAYGNIYTTGNFNDTADFDPGVGTYSLGSNGSSDIYISKLDNSGNFVWARNMGGSYGDVGNSIALDAAGNIYTSGIFFGTADFDPGSGTYNLSSYGSSDIFISKLDASGNLIWAKNMGGSIHDFGFSIALDTYGNVYTTGDFQGTADFDAGSATYNLISNGYSDIFISKLDSSGNLIWAKNMGGSSFDYCYSIALDASGNVYTTGTFKLTADFDPGFGTYNLTSNGSYDIFISKLSQGPPIQADFLAPFTTIFVGDSIQFTDLSTGSPTSWLWDFGDGASDTTQYPTHVYQTSGIFSVSLVVSNSTSSDTLIKPNYIVVIAPIQANFTVSDTLVLLGDSIQFTDLSTGSPTNWLWDFGDGATDTTQYPTHVYQTSGIFTVSLAVSNSSSSDTLIKQNYISVNPLALSEAGQNMSGIQLYQNVPNPFANETSFPFYLSVPTHIELDIFNVLGERVARVYSGKLKEGSHSIKFNNENLQNGTYYYRLETEDDWVTKKMVILKR